MTKEKAIELLSDMRDGCNCFDPLEEPHYRALSMGIEALKQTQWIPMSERPPEKNGNYLVTALYKGKPDVDMDYWQLGCMWDDWEDKVIAWMPLEPYQENINSDVSVIVDTLISKEKLIAKLKMAEMFNNINIPQWAWAVIKEFQK